MTDVLVAYRTRAKGGAEIVGVALSDPRLGDDSAQREALQSECEAITHREYAVVRRLYGDVPTLEVFARRFMRWEETSREARIRSPLLASCNFGEWCYVVEKREALPC